MRKRQEGAVMLVVMLVVMIATASAAVSVQNTQTELRAVGRERVAMHARYASEAALVTSIVWLDVAGNSGGFDGLVQRWRESPVTPAVAAYVEHEIPLMSVGGHTSGRMLQALQQANMNGPLQPLSQAHVQTGTTGAGGTSGDGASGDGASGDGAGGAAGGAPVAPTAIVDTTGSFGPRQAYVPTPYVADVTDCHVAPGTLVAGDAVGSGSTARLYCVLTARGRIEVPSGGGRSWTLRDTNFVQDTSGAQQDARATILTPPVTVSAGGS